MRSRSLVALLGLVALSCTGDGSRVTEGPSAATSAAPLVSATVNVGGVVTETLADGTTRTRALLPAGSVVTLDDPVNGSPVLRLTTKPEADTSTSPYPTISGPAPLTVRFNLCQSSDPDQNLETPEQGDSLNWQFHFGDSGTAAFNADGTFNPDFDHFCRVDHTYDQGRYTATVSVTDKILKDQGADVVAMARVSQGITIDAQVSSPGAAPSPSCPFTTLASTQWVATGSGGAPTCTCPSNGEVLDFFGGYASGCFAQGFFIASWSSGNSRCWCG